MMAAVAATVACDAPASISSGLTPLPDPVALDPGPGIDGYLEDRVPVGATALNGEGTLAFAQGQDGTVLFYDFDGRGIGEFGSSGQGPGECEIISGLGWDGRRLWVQDFRQQRLTWIDVDPEPSLAGDVAYRSFGPTTETGELPRFTRPTPIGAYPDGSLLMAMAGAPRSETLEGMRVLARVDTGGTVLRTVAIHPNNDGMVSLSHRSRCPPRRCRSG